MLRIGAVVERMPGPDYSAQLGFAELHVREPLPRAATLRRQRHERAPEVELALRAPPRALCSARGPLRFDAELERGLEWLLRASEALSAVAVVLPTPVELTPGQRSRDLLAEFAERLPRDAAHWVWAPRGPWEPADRYQLAQSLSLGCAFDPFEEPPPAAGVAYARLRALGTRHRFDDDALERVLQSLSGGAGEVPRFAAIESPRAIQEAARMNGLWQTRP